MREEKKKRRLLTSLSRRWGMQAVMWVTMVVLLCIAVFSLLYTTVVLYSSGAATSFLWFWPVTFAVAITAAIGLFLVLTGHLTFLRGIAALMTILFWILMLFIGCLEIKIFSAGRKAPKDDAKYVIILGAQVRGSVPSLVLNARINTAAEYLKTHPDAKAIASGGKGSGESISEAEAIKNGLLRLGITADRILMEAGSTSTKENLEFSKLFIPEGTKETEVVLVTNDFHVYRALLVAKKLGYENITGLGATDYFAVTIQYYIRESFAVVAEFFRGTI